jgi:hypothetical protein
MIFSVYWNSSRHMLSTRGLNVCVYAVDGSLLLRTGSLLRLKRAHLYEIFRTLSNKWFETIIYRFYFYRAAFFLLEYLKYSPQILQI